MQLRFAPHKLRLKQLDAAERLFEVIDKDKEYPFEFICFRITGFHPKGETAQQFIKGYELAEDIRILIYKLSGRLAQFADEQGEKVYTIEELAKKFDVSTKTIQRWQKRGLIAKKFIFNNGRKRFGFLQSKVDKFAQANPELTTKAKTFERLTNEQRQQIIKQAGELAATGGLSRYRIIKKIAAQFDKAHETIRYTLLNYEESHPEKPVFRETSDIMDPAQAGEVYKLYQQGCDAKELMKRFNRSKSSIYRIINIRRARALLARKIEFVTSDEFLEENAEEKILAKPVKSLKPATRQKTNTLKLDSSSMQQLLRTLKDTPVLNREREVELFRRYNFLKYLSCITRASINPANVSSTRLKKIEKYLAEAEKIKNMIIEANLRLVVSIASKHTTSGANLADLVSEGNVSLMRAIEKFDYTRGFRFATYATWTIAKDYARKMPAESARLDKRKAASLANIQRELRTKEAVDFAAFERARQGLAQVINNELTEREQYVILNRFGPIGLPIKKKTKTLKQIGEELGLSAERVRQVELIALQKLRHSLSSEEFELLTG